MIGMLKSSLGILRSELNFIKPLLVVCVGRTASVIAQQMSLPDRFQVESIYHPAFVLRTGEEKRYAFAVSELKGFYDGLVKGTAEEHAEKKKEKDSFVSDYL